MSDSSQNCLFSNLSAVTRVSPFKKCIYNLTCYYRFLWTNGNSAGQALFPSCHYCFYVCIIHFLFWCCFGCGYQGNMSSGLQFQSMVPSNVGSTMPRQISLFCSVQCIRGLSGLMLLSAAKTKTVN